MAIVAPGSTAPSWELTDLDGKTFVLEDVLVLYPVLMVFFRSACELCQWALPQLARYEFTFKGQDVEVYYVTSDPASVAEDTISAHRLSDIHVLLDPEAKVAKEYGVEHLPAVVFIANDGSVDSSAEGWVPDEYTAIGKAVKEYVAGIRGPLFGAAWDGEPCSLLPST